MGSAVLPVHDILAEHMQDMRGEEHIVRQQLLQPFVTGGLEPVDLAGPAHADLYRITGDQPRVLQLLQDRIQGALHHGIHTVRAVLKRVRQLIAVHIALTEHVQHQHFGHAALEFVALLIFARSHKTKAPSVRRWGSRSGPGNKTGIRPDKSRPFS